jgi:signal recognition particle subunit SRP72
VDSATKAVAVNNQLVMKPNDNPFENYKIHSIAHNTLSSSNPFSTQAQLFSFNALYLASAAHKSISKGIKHHEAQYKDFSPALIAVHSSLPPTDDPTFLPRLTSLYYRNERDVAVALLLVQTQLEKGNTHFAVATLEKLFHALKETPGVKFSPGLVALAMVLFPRDDKEDKATALLLEAKKYWSSQNTQVSMANAELMSG